MSYSASHYQEPPRRGFPHWRKMTWALIIWSLLIVVWVVGGVIHNETTTVQQCINDGVLGQRTCHDAVNAGTGIAVMLVIGLGFIGFVVLSLIWLMTRPRPVVIVQQAQPGAQPVGGSVPPPAPGAPASAGPHPRVVATPDSLAAQMYRRGQKR